MSIRHPMAGLVAVCVLVVACSGSATVAPAISAAPTIAGPSPSASIALVATPSATATVAPSATPTPSPSPVPTPTPTPTAAALTLDANVWWGGYEINVSGATYDALKRKLIIVATFLNTSTSPNDVSSLGSELNVVWNSTYLPGFIPLGAVPAGGTVRGEIQVQPPAGFTPEAAVLTFGLPAEHQATVPLNGTAATSERPTVLAVTGKVKMGKRVAYSVTSGLLIPAACSGAPNRLRYGPIKKDQMSIVLQGFATNSEAGYDGFIDKAFVKVPDGTTSAANPAVYIGVPSKGTVRDYALCFNVPAPASGAYTLTMHDSRSKKNGSIAFQVP